MFCVPSILLVHPEYYNISKIPPCVLFLPCSFFFHIVESFIRLVSSRSFILVRGEVHCVGFDRGESLMEVRRQMVVDVVVNEKNKLQPIFDIFFVFKTYKFWICTLYNIYGLIIRKFYTTYGLTICKYHTMHMVHTD